MMRRTFDVAVIGGGPAGTATAILLARAGFSILVLEGTNYQRPRRGETLPPTIAKRLRQLGVFDCFLSQGFLPAAGIVSAWGRSQLHINDFLFALPSSGWQVDRASFDRMFADAAVSAGSTVWTGSHLSSSPQRNKKHWHFEASSYDRKLNCTCRFLIDATGRCGTPWLSHLSQKIVIDGLIGITWTGKRDSEWPYTLVESVRDGWFYSASLPDSQATIVYMTDCDLYRQEIRRFPDLLWRELHRTHYTKLRFPAGDRRSNVKLFSAASTFRIQAAGESWCAVGDAALSLDPLSGLGVQHALDSALHAAEAVKEYFARGGPLMGYLHWIDQTLSTYMLARFEYYSFEKRWPGSLFWQRRNCGPPALCR
jgi:flavin-dependent dehydrogenase